MLASNDVVTAVIYAIIAFMWLAKVLHYWKRRDPFYRAVGLVSAGSCLFTAIALLVHNAAALHLAISLLIPMAYMLMSIDGWLIVIQWLRNVVSGGK